MTLQTEIDFTHACENNPVSQGILDSNRVRLSKQALTVFKLLAEGKQLTFDIAYRLYGIGDIRRRILDCEEKTGLKALRKYDSKGCGTYWFDAKQIEKAKGILNKIGENNVQHI